MLLRPLRTVLLTAAALIALPAAAQNSRPVATQVDTATPLPADTAWPGGAMTLTVDATDTLRGIFKVKQRIPVKGAGTVTLLYPEWLPGKHAPRGAIAEVAGFLPTGNGKPLAWRRDPRDVYAFHVDVPGGVRAIDLSFDFLSPTRTSEGRIVITPAMLNLQWEQVSFYPAGHATRNMTIEPTVILPAGWTGVAALDGLKSRGNRYTYATTSYETLVDSPMFAGAHFAKWDLGQNVTLNVVADEAKSLAAKPEHIATHRKLVDEAVALFGSRPFDRYEFLLALTDQMGGIGLEHHRSSENSREPDYFTKWADTGSERGLLPHELTHSWNGKYRRPAGLYTPDFRTPMQNNLLWLYEGQTSYWDLILAARSGMQSRDIVLGEFARYTANYSEQAGRRWRSVEDTTFDPITASRKPRPFPSWSRGEDYYNEGSLVWLEADMLIRERSNGARSLDDFARAFFGGRDGDWGELTYDFDGVVAALTKVEPYDWSAFLTQRLRSVDTPAPVGGIERGGYRLVWKEEPNAYDKERMTRSRGVDLQFSLGLSLDKGMVATNVQWDSPAFAQAITNGTKIVAVNGSEANKDSLFAAVTAAKDKKSPVTLLTEKGGRYRTVTLDWTGGLRFPHLEAAGGSAPRRLDAALTPRRP